jgi:hypothetical protein
MAVLTPVTDRALLENSACFGRDSTPAVLFDVMSRQGQVIVSAGERIGLLAVPFLEPK